MATIISNISDLINHMAETFNVDMDDAETLASVLNASSNRPDYDTDWAEYLADEPGNWGALHNYRSGDYIREATAFEWAESVIAAKTDGGAGVINTGDEWSRYVV